MGGLGWYLGVVQGSGVQSDVLFAPLSRTHCYRTPSTARRPAHCDHPTPIPPVRHPNPAGRPSTPRPAPAPSRRASPAPLVSSLVWYMSRITIAPAIAPGRHSSE
jgi:hypothetical protein